MFTGLIETVGELISRHDSGEESTLTIGYEPWESPLTVGESVAVGGVCLTVTSATARQFSADTLRETLSLTSLGGKRRGDLLNLERALRAGDRFGGHFVSGHVDGTGAVERVVSAGRDWIIRVRCGPELLKDVGLKGSVACDGVSLTVTAVTDTGFEVNVIPHTWSQTTLRNLRAGDAVNIETDLMVKHVRRCLETEGIARSSVSMETLQQAGFL